MALRLHGVTQDNPPWYLGSGTKVSSLVQLCYYKEQKTGVIQISVCKFRYTSLFISLFCFSNKIYFYLKQ